MSDNMDLVFWPACVRLLPFREQIDAAVAGGFRSMVVSADVCDDAARAGLALIDMKKIADDAGVPIRHFDSLTAWAPIRVPPGASPRMKARFDVPMEKALDICETLGVSNVNAVAGFPPNTLDAGVQIEGFAKLCDKVAAAEIHVDLEFMPILGVPDLGAAWNIVGGSARPNAGIMIDTWHFTKSGSSTDLLQSIPSRYLRSIQLSDGHLAQRGNTLLEDMLQHREFPGDGEFQVLELLQIVKTAGNLRHIGPEVFSLAADEMSARDAGAKSATTMHAMLAQAEMAANEGRPENRTV